QNGHQTGKIQSGGRGQQVREQKPQQGWRCRADYLPPVSALARCSLSFGGAHASSARALAARRRIHPVPFRSTDSKVLPSGEKTTALTDSRYLVSVARSWPAATSQSLTVWSPLAEATVPPSGEKATA